MLPRSSSFVPGFRTSEPAVSSRTDGLRYRSPYRPSQSSPILNNAYNPPARSSALYPASSPRSIDEVPKLHTRRAGKPELMLNQFAFRPPQHLSYAHQGVPRQSSPSPSSPSSTESSRTFPRSDATHGSRALRPSAVDDGQPALSKEPRKRDAYAAFSSPDSSWTTVPPAKKGKRKDKFATTARFRLPVRIAGPTGAQGNRGNDESGAGARAAKPGIMPYLPPPSKVPARGQDDDDRHEICPLPDTTPGSLSQYDQDTPSPSTFRPMAIRRAAPAHISLTSYHALKPTGYVPPVPRYSERPSPHHRKASCNTGDSTTLTFNEAGLPERYRLLRRGIAKVRVPSADPHSIFILPST